MSSIATSQPAMPLADGSPLSIVVTAHHWFDDVIGGAFRVATEFAEYLASLGHHVTYVCCGPQAQTRPVHVSRERGLDVRRYAPPTSGGRLARLRFHVRRSRELVQELLVDGKVDLIHGHSPLQHLGAANAVKRTPTRLCYVVHSPFDEELISNTPANWKSSLAAALAGMVERRNLRRASVVQTLSAFTLAELRRKHPAAIAGKGMVAPGWVDGERFQPARNRADARRELGGAWTPDIATFLTVRRLEARMGLDTLIEAAAIVSKSGRKFRLLIGGGGSQREALERLVLQFELQDVVSFLGRVPEDQLSLTFSAADCFVLPTRALECFGLIVLEAWATATPVIASRVAAIPELAEQQGSDWLFTAGDAQELAARMQSFLDGRLSAPADLRLLAEQYDRTRILREWARIALNSLTVERV